MEELNLTQQ